VTGVQTCALPILGGLKSSLFQNGPCYISFPVYNFSGRFWNQDTGNSMIGGHAVCVVGYNKEGVIIRNSWGSNWNKDGHTVYSYNDWGKHWEIWTTIDADQDDQDYGPDDDSCKCTLI